MITVMMMVMTAMMIIAIYSDGGDEDYDSDAYDCHSNDDGMYNAIKCEVLIILHYVLLLMTMMMITL